jgi:hypothetical protein
VLIDDRLPVSTTPRRADLAFEGWDGSAGLSFSRCGDGMGGVRWLMVNFFIWLWLIVVPCVLWLWLIVGCLQVSHQMLWACLIEKAYAKAHGSYKSTSGGEIQEALLDLTGAPCLSVNFNSQSFDSELLWRSMVEWKKLGLPMGCATSSDETGELKDVGIFGNHAYSVLSVREVLVRGGPWGGGTAGSAGGMRKERLVHVRNPHGTGEWNGEWSRHSDKWASVVSIGQGGSPGAVHSGHDDGTFWMDWTHFLMGFSVVEVCLAYRGWHCRSLPNSFPNRNSMWRVCSHTYRFRAPEGESSPTTVYIMSLQPSKRGAWAELSKKKKSYRPGDVSIVVARLQPDGESIAAIVGGALHGADKVSTQVLTLEAGAEYLIVPYCLGSNPTAAETTVKQPFFVRFYASTPLVVKTQPFVEQQPQHQQLSLEVLHGLLLDLQPAQPLRPGGWMSGEEDLVGRVKRRKICAGPSCSIVVVTAPGGVLAVVAANQSSNAVKVEVTAYTKSNAARTGQGKLVSDTAKGAAYYEKIKAMQEEARQVAAAAQQRRPGGGNLIKVPSSSRDRGGFRWPAKWQAFCATATVPSGHQRLVLLLVKSGVQAQLGDIEARLIPGDGSTLANSGHSSNAAGATARPTGVQTSLHGWLGAAAVKTVGAKAAAKPPAGAALRAGIFSAVPCVAWRHAWQGLEVSGGVGGRGVGTASDCGGGHGLTAGPVPRPGFRCDICFTSLSIGRQVYSCRSCNHDVCGQCFVGTVRTSDDAELAQALAASKQASDLQAALEASQREYSQRQYHQDHEQGGNGSDDLAAAIAASLNDQEECRNRGGGRCGGDGSCGNASRQAAGTTARPRDSSCGDVVELLSSEEEEKELDSGLSTLSAPACRPPRPGGASDGMPEGTRTSTCAGTWHCARCTFQGNPLVAARCEICDMERHD